MEWLPSSYFRNWVNVYRNFQMLLISNVSLNMAIKFATFVVWPSCMGRPTYHWQKRWDHSTTFYHRGYSSIDGLLIPTCLPTTIIMWLVLSSTSGGKVVGMNLCEGDTWGWGDDPTIIHMIMISSSGIIQNTVVADRNSTYSISAVVLVVVVPPSEQP